MGFQKNTTMMYVFSVNWQSKFPLFFCESSWIFCFGAFICLLLLRRGFAQVGLWFMLLGDNIWFSLMRGISET